MKTATHTEDLAVHSDRLAALGNEARLTIVRMLLQALPGELSAGDIAQQTGIPNSTLSHHLERLRREGLVNSRKDKQWVWYQADTATLADLVGFLAAVTTALAAAGVPVLPLAASRRDHILVPAADVQRAQEALSALAEGRAFTR